MSGTRTFARFNLDSPPPVVREVPPGGMCLSSFVVVSKTNEPNMVALGHINPTADWESLGALGHERVERFKGGLLLPSSHLMLYESPQAAAERIAKEQLGMPELRLSPPVVVSEVYGEKNHWDFEFISRGEADQVRKTDAWTDLSFVDLSSAKPGDFARSHNEVLMNIGLWRPVA